jgi:hypothetical protein
MQQVSPSVPIPANMPRLRSIRLISPARWSTRWFQLAEQAGRGVGGRSVPGLRAGWPPSEWQNR